MFETKINGVWYAVDDSNCAYVQDSEHPESDEYGYRKIGNVEWTEDEEFIFALRRLASNEVTQ